MTERKTLVKTVLGDTDLLLYSMEGEEALSEPFTLTLQLLSNLKNPPIDQQALLGTPMTVHLEPVFLGGTPLEKTVMRYWHGYVARVQQEHGSRGRYRVYTVELRPWLWFLSQSSDCRIFQQQSVPQIIEQVFTENGFTDYELNLGSYAPREYCVQYRETDLDFVHRLLEHEGIYYYFKHQQSKHTLVLVDGTTAHMPLPQYASIDFAVDESMQPDTIGERIDEWRPVHQVCTGSYAHKDYDFKRPNLRLYTRCPPKQLHKLNRFEKYDYPGGYTEESTGNRYARIRLEAEHALFNTVDGAGNTHGIAPGSTFTLAVPSDDVAFALGKEQKEHLVARAHYSFAVQPYETTEDLALRPFRCTFSALKAPFKFRPPRKTPRPVVGGLHVARVVGRKGEEIDVDEYGRIKVQFAWDMDGTFDENSSCRIRVAQKWAGSKWGAQHWPRIGNEVVVSFVDGDPDRPLVVGSVYNGKNKPPFAKDAESGLKTDSTKNAVGFNQLSFVDTAGKELIDVHAQRDMRTKVKHDMETQVKNEYSLEAGRGSETLNMKQLELKFGIASVTLRDTLLAVRLGATSVELTPLGITLTGPTITIRGMLKMG